MTIHDLSVKRDADAPDNDIIDLGEILTSLWRGKFLILAITALFALFGGYYAYQVATPKYRATSVMLLDTAGSQLVDLGISLPSLGSDSQAINTEVEVLKSRRLLQRVVEAESLTTDPEFNGALRAPGLRARLRNALFGTPPAATDTPERAMERAINTLIAGLSARNLPNTNILQITVESESPAKSAALADQIAEQYIRYKIDVKYEATRDASQWLAHRVADLKLDLEQAEARVADYSSRSDVVSEASLLALDRQLKDTRNRLENAQAAVEAAKAEAALLNSLRDADAAQKADAISDARLRLIFRESGAGRLFDARFDTLIERTDQRLRNSEAQNSSLAGHLKTLEAQFQTQSDQLIQLQQLTREAEASRLLYEYFLGRLKETSAQEGLQQAESRILSNAVVPSVPSEPRKKLILVIWAGLGLLLSSAYVLLRDARQNTYRLAAELEAEVHYPVMGQIPVLPTKSRHDDIKYLIDKPTSVAAEAVRNLRTSVLLSDSDTPPKVIMTSSAVPNEGKTTISFALAQNLANMGKKVLMIEGDMRRGIFGTYLAQPPEKGLISVVEKQTTLQDVVHRDPGLEFDLLTSELSSVSATDILSSAGFRDLLTAAREEYDYVIIDTPPVLVVPDARVVAQMSDMILFAVHWDHTRRTQVKEALRMFASVNRPVDGLVLNKVNHRGMKRYGYEDSYGTYGKNYYNN